MIEREESLTIRERKLYISMGRTNGDVVMESKMRLDAKHGIGIPAGKITSFIAYLGENGIVESDLAREFALDSAALRDPGARIPLDLWLRLNRRASALLEDPDFGLHYGMYFWGMPSLLGHLLSACRNVDEVLEKYLRYQQLEHDAWRLDVLRSGDSVELEVVPSCPEICDRLVLDFIFASLYGISARLTGRPLELESVSFSYERPKLTDAHHRIFRCPVNFSCARNVISVKRECFAVPVRNSSADVRDRLEEPLERALKAAGYGKRISSRVSGSIALRRGEKPATLATVADELGMSARDLQLKLKAEGTTFQQLRDSFLKQMSLEYLSDGTLSIKEIAFLTGFSETSAFHRAFVRWTGKTPGQVRAGRVGLP